MHNKELTSRPRLEFQHGMRPLSSTTQRVANATHKKTRHAVRRGGLGVACGYVLTICRRIFASDYFFYSRHLNRDTRNLERLTP